MDDGTNWDERRTLTGVVIGDVFVVVVGLMLMWLGVNECTFTFTNISMYVHIARIESRAIVEGTK